MSVVGHLSIHPFLKEGRPSSIDKETRTLLDLIRVPRLVSSSFSNLLLALGASESLLERVLLVLDRGLERGYTLLALLLFVIDHLH